MITDELEKKYKIKIVCLSNRARFVLSCFKLDQFENFLHFFIEEKRAIDFTKVKNCGPRTESELNKLVNVMVRLATEMKGDVEEEEIIVINKKIQLLFDKNFDKLNRRTKNVLSAFGADNIKGFHKKVLHYTGTFDLKGLKNCGDNTSREIVEFKEKVLKIIDENKSRQNSDESLNNICIPSEINLNQKLFEINGLSNGTELLFDQRFDELKVRTKNILIDLGANSIQGFIEKILKNNSLYKLSALRNCGSKTYEEILEFKNRVSIIIEEDKNEGSFHGLFKDIEIYLFGGNVLKGVELDIVLNYYCFVQNEKNETLEVIAKKFGLTKERARQISIRILDDIKSIVDKIINKKNHDLKKYFHADYFHATQDLAKWINSTEFTDFNSSFINYVLQFVNINEYDFICMNPKIQLYSGIFVKKSLQIDFKKCFEFLSGFLQKRIKKDIVIEIDYLIKSFKKDKNTSLFSEAKNLNLLDRMHIIGVIKLFTTYVSNQENQIEISSDNIIFKRNTKKLQYEFLVDILKEYKKPLHFSELYSECTKRQINAGSALSIHGAMQHYPQIFGLKGPGIYGLIEWGGYFGTIGDVTEKLLKERMKPIDRRELENILCRELYISQDSIINVLFNYEPEKRFIKMKNNTIGLKEWS